MKKDCANLCLCVCVCDLGGKEMETTGKKWYTAM